MIKKKPLITKKEAERLFWELEGYLEAREIYSAQVLLVRVAYQFGDWNAERVALATMSRETEEIPVDMRMSTDKVVTAIKEGKYSNLKDLTPGQNWAAYREDDQTVIGVFQLNDGSLFALVLDLGMPSGSKVDNDLAEMTMSVIAHHLFRCLQLM